MKNSTPLANEPLLNDAMSTPSLEAFYDDVEQQLVARMETNTPPPPARGSGGSWRLLGGSAIVILAVGAAVTYYATRQEPLTVSTAHVRSTSEPAAVTTTATTHVATHPETHSSASPTTSHPAVPQQQIGGATSVAKVTAQAQPTKTLSTQTQRDIDSLSLALRSASTPSDAARIEYQLGVRYRIAGEHSTAYEHLTRASTTAERIGANLLAARGRQQAAKAALQMGEKSRAVTLYTQALAILPTEESTVRAQWQREVDSIQR